MTTTDVLAQDTDVRIAHLALHGWEPIKVWGYIGVRHESAGMFVICSGVAADWSYISAPVHPHAWEVFTGDDTRRLIEKMRRCGVAI